MKKVLASAVALGCLAAAGSAFAGIPAGTGVNGSLHDMNGVVSGNADSMGRVCVFCHAPHHAMKDVPTGLAASNDYPLWNHQFSNANFTPYSWATPSNQVAEGFISDPLTGPSRLCMTCHDGNVAIDEHGGTFSQAGTVSMGQGSHARANLTNDLSNTHPIGFDYNQIAGVRNAKSSNGSNKQTDGSFLDGTEIVPSTNHYADSISISSTQGQYNTVSRQAGGKTIKDNLYNGSIMTCATCHEVHNKENATQDTIGAVTPNYFLYAKENKSLICLSCHVK